MLFRSPCSSITAVLLARPPPSPIVEELNCRQAETTGPDVLPKIFFNETFPLTCGFVFDVAKLGNSGKSVLESLGGGFVVELFDEDEAAAELADHGVLRCA